MHKKNEEIQKRHSLIKHLISSDDIYNQTQLAKLLKQNKITVTQATLSRDLFELGVVRVPSPNGNVYRISPDENKNAFQYRIAEEVISIDSNESLIVIKTYTGRAQGVALFIDRQNSNEILGTIAGDDTIIVVPKSGTTIIKLVNELKTLLGIK
ncbi:MAG: arginine repressor [Ignavibacteriales bacterium CG_4_9_14_3_um_filter_34_10]|nr:MAG: arginine repressor [Ignavibacteriales bacterium CG_4_9_14_3_um_filter_34_10]